MRTPLPIDRRQFVIAAAIAASASGIARAARPSKRWPAVQALIDQMIAERKFAGVATALCSGNARPEFVVAGTLAYGSPVPIDRDSLFRLYSVTKQVTGIAAMLLVEDGRITLDQPVAEVLPELRNMRVATDPERSLDARPASRPITMRQLLTHTSGLSNWQPTVGDTPIARAYRERGMTPGSYVRQPGEDGYAEQVDGLAALIARLPEVPLIAEPGTAWHYSMGLDVMGAVIERVTGVSLDAFMQQRLFVPLGMQSTGFQVAAKDARRLTTLYGNSPEGPVAIDLGTSSIWLKPPRLAAGGGGLVSSPGDLIRFGRMVVNGGSLDGVRVMKAETVRLALSNLLPQGVTYPPTGGFGAGAGVVMPGVRSDNGGAGVWSAVGASSTYFAVDPRRQRTALFLAQFMPGPRVPMPEALRFRTAFNQAVDVDLGRSA